MIEFLKINLPSNKNFGLLFSLITLIISLYFFTNNEYYLFNILLFITLLSFLLAIKFPTFFKPFNYSWMLIGKLLGKIINPILLGIIYFGLFSTIGLFRRLYGVDELNLNIKLKNTYWIKSQNKHNLESFKRQF